MYTSIKRSLYGFAALAMVFSTGCAGMSNTAQDGLVGGGVGAGVGALVGAATGHAGAGAAIGGVTGALVGGAVGSEKDQQEKRELQNRAIAAENTGPRVGITEVIQMTQQGVAEEVIINQIRTTNSTFVLSAGDITMLQENRVSPRVVVVMQNQRPRAVVRTRPQVIYAAPYYPPPPPVGVGVTYVVR